MTDSGDLHCRECSLQQANTQTLASYDADASRYFAHTSSQMDPLVQRWLKTALDQLEPGACLLEIGSGPGRDAAWIEQHGFQVVRTEASAGMRHHLQTTGHEVLPLNVLTDEIEQRYPMIHAGAVLHHFPPHDLQQALRRIYRWLLPGGLLTCSVRQGVGQCWEQDKLSLPRYFCYWQTDNFSEQLQAAGLPVTWLLAGYVPNTNKDWIMTISRRSC